ncbi:MULTISPECIES: helix-turn-helix transcriptional regulator [unclassified Ciceribacter]|uniref:transcriptional regulator VisR n=1 Tax=unclassified Ciceribacter TaxID=2628820 RepID=UPI001FEDB435|nr:MULTISPECIES: helix-turn-helix transcriptional regulator [unclassified Ciceribacter]
MPAVQIRNAVSRSDVFPKFLSIQKSLNTRSFAFLRVSGASLPGKRRLETQMENWDPVVGGGSAAFVGAYGDQLLQHLDVSILPMVWNAQDGEGLADVYDFAPFVIQLKQRLLPNSGIAFPVRLGAVGNGVVIFASNLEIDLSGEAILDAHGRCCKLVMEVLALEERRLSPSDALSDREIACLQLAGDGRISEEIAEKLGLSVHTVNAYLGSATIKLDSVNRIQAIAKAIRLGYIH